MSLKVGSLVFATQQGLGVLAKAFWDHGIINDVLVVHHGSRVNFGTQWYPGKPIAHEVPPKCKAAQWLCDKCDVMLFLETPFTWDLIPYCQRRGIKTVIMPMYECMPISIPYEPDLWLCPSTLDLQYYPRSGVSHRESVYLPVPVDTNLVGYRQRTTATTFVHNGGNGGLKGRNGTSTLVDAMKYVKSPIRLILRSQHKLQWDVKGDSRIDLREESVPYDQLWKDGGEGDVYVWPHKFDGLSLPLQEACASGMMVMGVDRDPDREWLPTAPLIPSSGYNRIQAARGCTLIDEALIDPKTLAAHIDKWYNQDIQPYSYWGQRWRQEHSWETLAPKYLEVLEDLFNG